jgi:hypothetical protein
MPTNLSFLAMVGTTALLLAASTASGQVKVIMERNAGDTASAEFRFKNVPPPARNDAATEARFTLVDGRQDANGGSLDRLHDGQLPGGEDEPAENFFFRAGTEGGRIAVDLGKAVDIQQINTYSWHANTRAPQVYTLFGSDGQGDSFNARPVRGTDPATCGWKKIARVDSRPGEGDGGGQHGVSITDGESPIGRWRHLLFDIERAEDRDAFGNTFYSEIDVLDRQGPAPQRVEALATVPHKKVIEMEGGKYQITLDASETPDLTNWTDQVLAPVVAEWYPKLIRMLPSEGFEAPRQVRIVFKKNMQGVAATSGTVVNCAGRWFRQNLKSEAVGSIVHELVHVTQQYGRARRTNPSATRAPGWLTEGIADYIRWYLYEPQTRGAEISRNNVARARYDASYRVSANFLNWVVTHKDKDLLAPLNAAIREGKYTEDLWKQRTGRTLQELGDEWKKSLE